MGIAEIIAAVATAIGAATSLGFGIAGVVDKQKQREKNESEQERIERENKEAREKAAAMTSPANVFPTISTALKTNPYGGGNMFSSGLLGALGGGGAAQKIAGSVPSTNSARKF